MRHVKLEVFGQHVPTVAENYQNTLWGGDGCLVAPRPYPELGDPLGDAPYLRYSSLQR